MILNRFNQMGSRAALIAACGACIGPSTLASAQSDGPIIIGETRKLEWFKVESFRASIEAYWRYRDDESTDASGVKTKDTESLIRETLNLSGEGFLGDPNLVKLNVDLHFQLSQEEINSQASGRNDRTGETLSEYDVSAIVLQKSKLPITVYSKRSQVLLDRQFADSLDSITSESGVRVSLRSDLMPSQFLYFHRDQDQTGRFSGTDSSLSQDSIEWQGRLVPSNGNRMWWDYTYSKIDESGQLLVPNSFTRHDAFFNHIYDFGDESQNHLRSSLRVYKETGKFPIEQIRINESLEYEHTPHFDTKYIYLFDQQKRRLSTQTLNRGMASFHHELFDSLTTTGEIGASQLRVSEGNFESTQYFADLELRYRKLVPLGVLDATTNIDYNQTSDGERGSSIFITAEPHSFGSSGLFTLNRRNILPGSIVLTDIAGIVTYIQGSDYSVIVLGESIEVRRVLGGNISAGETVLVTYEIGPEPASDTTTTGIGLTVRYRFEEGMLKGLSPYFRYRDQSQDRTGLSGIGLPRTDFQDFVFGVDYDLGAFSMTGEHQIHDSVISPFERTRLEGRYIRPINRNNSITVSAYYQDTDRVDENLQTTITNITARWNAQPRDHFKSSLVGIWRREEDNSGLDSQAYEVSVDLNWRLRQTSVYCSLKNSVINSNTRDSMLQTFTFGARRAF